MSEATSTCIHGCGQLAISGYIICATSWRTNRCAGVDRFFKNRYSDTCAVCYGTGIIEGCVYGKCRWCKFIKQ
jgi:hypothetical protein